MIFPGYDGTRIRQKDKDTMVSIYNRNGESVQISEKVLGDEIDLIVQKYT